MDKIIYVADAFYLKLKNSFIKSENFGNNC